MNYNIVIPARLKSTRLPNKMLRELHGKPLIEWTWLAAIKSKAKNVIVATDDQAIFDHLTSIDAKVVMTDTAHESGTDRLSEVSRMLQFSAGEIIVNWQGDEPFLPISFVDQVVLALAENSNVSMSTLATPINEWEEVQDPNAVKVVLNEEAEALYFSRAPIPYQREKMQHTGLIENSPYLRHIGLYAYRAEFLNEYPHLTPSPLEELEKLEQLRALANNRKIAVAISTHTPPPGIDTLADLQKAQAWIINNGLI
ncbi:3-deoxy-manno-octulosonate cytidylyltransferase [Ignatzschineria rhizosphaerae]|uniref:3-deoxy-manno-octulosonate cytidylyltransferase n=1 Tax=Ignatzschineria rhizosphaerae TaxID=2923279 RepID=A0ABY3X6K9_9GAMM|nr:3-deoxy-manno-octulosonate cytidylyltransferase [Ignatzschineria rhizosphaerae]UNM96667.1 3-deoxy-manno-octulosonate cytidylyltransferase [Ignatzschineria rhizosphaerae]